MRVIQIAKSYLGEKEKSGNQGFVNASIEKKMIADGWKNGEPWCCYAMEMIYEDAYPEYEKEFDRLFSGHCITTLKNFKAAGYIISSKPVLGSLMVMQQFKNNVSTTNGHIGLVCEILLDDKWKSIEGNTNSNGSREGDSFQEKTRSPFYLRTGKRVIGFIDIINTLKITS